jgi:hypothetical protein
MPHLYLPSEHTDADLVLAADIAAAVASADLYVAWTHDSGQGAPEIEAVVREERPAPPHPFAELVVAVVQGVSALWRTLTGPSSQRLPAPQITERPAGETV